ncbi:MAG: hypothetical protein RH949_25370 [Coleofasciculus sp. A1-SPW-01]|uniref:hypothetical protein n=1 Tax=Coleofasciculus sp. A1-SPW-01 TaxID=3070819 RepID=UPI0032FA63D2
MMFRNKNDIGLLQIIASLLSGKLLSGLLVLGIIVGVYSGTRLRNREDNLYKNINQLSSQNTKEKSQALVALFKEEKLLSHSTRPDNDEKLDLIYQEILQVDPKNVDVYIRMALRNLKQSQATRYESKTEAEKLKQQGIRNLETARKLYQEKGWSSKEEQTVKLIEDINNGVASYNWCFPTTLADPLRAKCGS